MLNWKVLLFLTLALSFGLVQGQAANATEEDQFWMSKTNLTLEEIQSIKNHATEMNKTLEQYMDMPMSRQCTITTEPLKMPKHCFYYKEAVKAQNFVKRDCSIKGNDLLVVFVSMKHFPPQVLNSLTT